MGVGEGTGSGVGEGNKEVNLEVRDPTDINDHLKVAFEDVIAEPDDAHSINCVWKCSFCCFNCGKNCCYEFLSLLCGCCYGLGWGMYFGIVTFVHVWQCTPCLRCFAINCGFLQKLWGTTLQCLLAPVCETMGLCLSRIQVAQLKDMVS